MSDPGETNGRASAAELDRDSEVSGEAVRDLVRGALLEPDDVPDLTRGFQRKIRERSGGKFYTDGWSTAKHPPLNTYLVTSLMMLFVLAVIYALLAPLSGAPEPAPPSKPVQVVPQR
jgi:hypothetical protein